jgi:type IV secretory pathway TraG/TraD family ATPase VirD4
VQTHPLFEARSAPPGRIRDEGNAHGRERAAAGEDGRTVNILSTIQQWGQWFNHGWHTLVPPYLVTTGAYVLALAWRRGAWQRFFTAPFAGVPLTFFGVITAALIEWAVLQPMGINHRPWAALASLGFVFVGAFAGAFLPRGARAPAVKRGTVIEIAEGKRPRTARERAKLTSRGILTFAGVDVPFEDETKHFKLIGTTGTGKSTAIAELLEGALARGDRAVFADPDGGYAARFYNPARGDVILNPFDTRSRKWDVFGELRTDYDYDQLARSLIPEGTGSDRVWRTYAQTFFSAVVRQAHALGVRDSGELYRLLTSASIEELRILLEGTPAQPFVEESNHRMFGSIRSVTSNAVAPLGFIQRQTSDLFSIRQWVTEGRGVLFLPYQADQIAALRSVISTWVRIAIFQTMSQGEKDHRLWFVIDELDALGAIDGLKDALARLRKFGGRCVIGFQSIAQVSGIYGNSESQTIVENCGNTLILRCSASEQGGTARFASRLIGEREIVRENVTRSRAAAFFDASRSTESHSVQHVVEFAVLPSEIEQLPDLVGYLKLASRPQWLHLQVPRNAVQGVGP